MGWGEGPYSLRRLCQQAGALTLACSIQWRLRYAESIRKTSDHDSRADAGEKHIKALVISHRYASILTDPQNQADSVIITPRLSWHIHLGLENEPVAPSMQWCFDIRQDRKIGMDARRCTFDGASPVFLGWSGSFHSGQEATTGCVRLIRVR